VSDLLLGSVLLLSLDLAAICLIFASSIAISKLSLMQDPKYVWASPIACFYIFGTTALSIIAAAGSGLSLGRAGLTNQGNKHCLYILELEGKIPFSCSTLCRFLGQYIGR
jgi:hypothetical protein